MGDYDRRMINSVKRATLSLVNDAGGMQAVQLNGYNGEVYNDVPRLQSYGFNSIPLPASGNSAAECVVVHPGMVASRAVALCLDDRRYRPLGGHPGDVAVYSNLDTPTASNAASAHRIALSTEKAADIYINGVGGTLTINNGAGTVIMTQSAITVTFGGSVIVANASGVTVTAPTVTVNASGNASVTAASIAMTATGGTATLAGNFTVNGTITATGNITAGGIDLEHHVHTNVQSGSSNTGGPTG